LGHDAPEIYEARCDAEYLLGQEAAAALKLLAADPRAELRGGEMKDKHGRRMGVLEIAGVPLSSILVAEGVAHYERRRSEYTVYYDGLLKRTDWCSFLATYGRPRKSCHLGPALPVGVPC
jgi:endonuclease YncB( thermonuclease family)